MDLPFNLDFEHGNFFDQLPAIVMCLPLLIMILPLPTTIKPTLIGGLVIIGFALMFGMPLFAQVAAAKHIVIKARLMPYGIEKEFHCRIPEGNVFSDYNPATRTYTSYFDLAISTTVPDGYGGMINADKIEIEHRFPWEKRTKLQHGWVHYRGIETELEQVIYVELWPQLVAPRINRYSEVTPKFSLRSGNRDFYIMKGKERTDLELEDNSP